MKSLATMLLGAFALLGAAVACAQSNDARPSAAKGKDAYLAIGCQKCHGTVGHGGAGKPLAPNLMPLAAFVTWVRTGSPGWSFANGMPAFPPGVISDAALADVHAYLASVPKPPPPDSVPLLRLDR
jgi:mono/diheme cytochrome c family protein